ncbi:hypothetical protein Tco_0572854 [Tanacetum coccineum]
MRQLYGGVTLERAITTDASLVAAQDIDNIIRTQTTTMPNVDIFSWKDTGGIPGAKNHCGALLRLGGHTPGSDEGRLKLEELMAMLKSSDDDLDEEDASRQVRISDKTKPMFKDSDFDDLVDKGMDFVQEKDAENQGNIGADDTEVVKGSGDTEAVNTTGEGVSTAAPRTPPTTTVFDDEDVTMAMAQTLIKTKEEKAKEKGVAIKDVEDSSRPIRSITTL